MDVEATVIKTTSVVGGRLLRWPDVGKKPWKTWTVGAVLLAVAGLAGTANAQDQSPLSARERARLSEGELVVRETEEVRGTLHLIGGTSFQVVDLPAGAVWRAVQDVERFRHMLPQVAESQEVSRNGSTRVVKLRHRMGPANASYHLRMTYQRINDRDRVVIFQLDDSRPSALRAGWGFFRVRPWAQGKTILSFGVMVDVGDNFFTDVAKPKIHEWILKIPLTLKQYVEGRGRERYAGR